MIEAHGGNDTLDGGTGDDELLAGSGDDHVTGGAGADVISDGLGCDVVDAGDGDDHIVAAADAADDAFHGGAGHDTLDYSAASDDLDVDLAQGQVASAETGDDAVSGIEEVVGGSGNDHFRVGPDNSGVVATGNAGDDTFEYAAPTDDHVVLHEIVDFQAGDRIRMSKYDIFEKVFDQVEDQFAKIYGDKVDEDDARIRYRVEQTGEIDRTVVEADMDRDDIFEVTIHLQGSHALVIVEAA